MHNQDGLHGAAVVTIPAEVDLTCQDRVCDRLHAALASATPVVIADFTGTAFCDCSALRCVVQVRHRAAALGAELRLVIPPGGAVHRLAALLEIDRVMPLYSSVSAAAAGRPAADPAAVPARRSGSSTAASADIADLIRASRRHIARWRAWFGELRHRTDPAAGRDLAVTWDTVAAQIDLHMRAEEEICGPTVYRAAPHGAALTRQIRDTHADIRELIAEASLQRPGSPQWQDLVSAALSAWDRHCDEEEHGPEAEWLRRADPALRRQLARQWRAFREACVRDLYPDVPKQFPTCELRLAQPVAPRLADPCFGPLACTCQACTSRLSQIAC